MTNRTYAEYVAEREREIQMGRRRIADDLELYINAALLEDLSRELMEAVPLPLRAAPGHTHNALERSNELARQALNGYVGGDDRAEPTALGGPQRRIDHVEFAQIPPAHRWLYPMGTVRHVQMNYIPTGVVALDRAIGVGGIPRGRIAEVYGYAGVGKTLLGLSTVQCAQAMGGTVAWVTGSAPPSWEGRGIDRSRLFISQPSTQDRATDVVDGLMAAGSIDLLVLEGLDVLPGIHGVDAPTYHRHARAQRLRAILNSHNLTQTAVLVLTSLNRGPLNNFHGVDPLRESVENAAYTSVTIRMVEDGPRYWRGRAVATAVRFYIPINRYYRPTESVVADRAYGGFTNNDVLYDLAESAGLIDRPRGMVKFLGRNVGPFRLDVIGRMTADPHLRSAIKRALSDRSHHLPPGV